MRRKSFEDAECPIARGIDQVGDWWSLLILRDAFDGLTRFDQFERSLGIAPGMLTRRLRGLVEDGLLTRVAYSQRPPRHDYRLTERGKALRPVLIALYAWQNRLTPEADRTMVLVDRDGVTVDPVLVDRRTGKSLGELGARFVPGPAAGDGMRRRLDRHSEGTS
jgi:DNA-binding HxlR family transcriptional regulator